MDKYSVSIVQSTHQYLWGLQKLAKDSPKLLKKLNLLLVINSMVQWSTDFDVCGPVVEKLRDLMRCIINNDSELATLLNSEDNYTNTNLPQTIYTWQINVGNIQNTIGKSFLDIDQNGGDLFVTKEGERVSKGWFIGNHNLTAMALGKEGYVLDKILPGVYPNTSESKFITAKYNPTNFLQKYRFGWYNIRYRNSGDTGEKHWDKRKHRVFKLIKDYSFDLLGMSELMPIQAREVREEFPEYGYYGVGRTSPLIEDNLNNDNEQVAIIYKNALFEKLDSGYFFLYGDGEELKLIPGKLSEADQNRLIIWVKLKDKNTDKTFYVFSTHIHGAIDDPGSTINEDVRISQINIANKCIDKIIGQNCKSCVFFCGDFNAFKGGEAYNKLKESWKDSSDLCKTPLQGMFERTSTYTGHYSTSKTLKSYIDYILIKDPTKIDVTAHIVVDDKADYLGSPLSGGSAECKLVYPSDHLPVLIECLIK